MMYVLTRIAYVLISLLDLALILRAILSWIPGAADNAFGDVLYTITEPLLCPIRVILERISFLRELPIDFAPLVAMLLLSVLMHLLGGI